MKQQQLTVYGADAERGVVRGQTGSSSQLPAKEGFAKRLPTVAGCFARSRSSAPCAADPALLRSFCADASSPWGEGRWWRAGWRDDIGR